MDITGILTIIGIVVMLGLAGGFAFGALKVKQLNAKLDSQVAPKLDDLHGKLGNVKAACAQADPLMQSVNVALDALDVEVVKADGKLNQLKGLTGKISGVVEMLPTK